MAHWYENSNLDNDMMLAISDSSYINDQLNLKWLYYFNKYIVKLIISLKWFLFLDKYKSYHNIKSWIKDVLSALERDDMPNLSMAAR